MIKILYLTVSGEDYLADGVLHGLRQLEHVEAIDFPKKEVMYENYDPNVRLYGNGFTLYRTLRDGDVDRTNIDEKVASDYFDLIIFSCIHRQPEQFKKFYRFLKPDKTVFLDGEDYEALFAEIGGFRSFFKAFSTTKVRHAYYFKRELTRSPKTFLFPRLFGISFGFPEEKIVPSDASLSKLKDFPEHIVDKEVFLSLGRSAGDIYKFEKEQDYYRDLQHSKFGITTEKGGWDCMRHYEIAANRALMCFRDLDQKPAWCAPHGLEDGVNCLVYKNSSDLKLKISNLKDDEYQQIVTHADSWIRSKTTTKIAERILEISR